MAMVLRRRGAGSEKWGRQYVGKYWAFSESLIDLYLQKYNSITYLHKSVDWRLWSILTHIQ